MERFQNTRQPDWGWWAKLWPAPGETLRKLGLGTDDDLLEVGSGNGYFTLPAARIVDPGQVYALDLDASLLDELEQFADQQEITNVTTIRGDARSLADHLSAAVDVALIANTFHGIEDPPSFLDEVAAVLAGDGRFVVVNWRDLPEEATTVAGERRGPPAELRLSPDGTRRIVQDAVDGRLATQVDIPPYHYGLVFER